VYGEGPTKMGGGEFTSPTALTTSDIRYTQSKDGDALYAIFGGWPGNGKQVNLASVTTSRFALGSGKVFLFGPTGNGTGEIALQATQDSSGLHITLPATQPYTALAYAIKISKSGAVPAATPWLSGGSTADAGVPGTGGSRGSTDASADSRIGSGSTDGAFPGSGGAMGAGGAGAGGAGAGGGGRSGTGGSSTGASGTGGGTSTGGTTAPSSAGGTSGSGGVSAADGSGGKGGGTVASGGAGAGGTVSGLGGAGGSAPVGGSGQGGSASSGTTIPQVGSNPGCSCSAPGAGRSNTGSIVLLGFALAFLLRRRR